MTIKQWIYSKVLFENDYCTVKGIRTLHLHFTKQNFQLDHCDCIYAYDTRWNLDTATQNATGK